MIHVARGATCRLLALLSLAASLCFAANASAETTTPSNPSSASPASSTVAASASPTASPALPELSEVNEGKPENPFYRFEIVSLGSYPITLFYVGLAFDFKRYSDNGFDSAYVPLFSDDSLTDSDRWVRLGAALCVSCVVGAIDAIIHDSKVKAAKRLRAAEADAAAAAASKAEPEPSAASP
jgi:hypothetical protein